MNLLDISLMVHKINRVWVKLFFWVCSCVCPVFISTTQPICLHASFYQPQDNMVNAISCKWWILNTQRSLNMVQLIGTFCHSRIWFHFVIAYLLDVLLKFHWLKKSLTKMRHSTAFPNSEEKKTAQEIWPKYGEFGKYDWHSLMNERTNEWMNSLRY